MGAKPVLDAVQRRLDERIKVDARCTCAKCEERTSDTYTMEAACGNCNTSLVVVGNCNTSLVVVIRMGDRKPLMLTCPGCEVRAFPIWRYNAKTADGG